MVKCSSSQDCDSFSGLDQSLHLWQEYHVECVHLPEPVHVSYTGGINLGICKRDTPGGAFIWDKVGINWDCPG